MSFQVLWEVGSRSCRNLPPVSGCIGTITHRLHSTTPRYGIERTPGNHYLPKNCKTKLIGSSRVPCDLAARTLNTSHISSPHVALFVLPLSCSAWAIVDSAPSCEWGCGCPGGCTSGRCGYKLFDLIEVSCCSTGGARIPIWSSVEGQSLFVCVVHGCWRRLCCSLLL